ncbi:MAG: SusC/RagA family TonB-linked outer membrane protein [Prolixibacteraceae bacterium]
MTKPLKTILLILFVSMAFCASSIAQNSLKTCIVAGYVTADGYEKLPGVNVYLKGTTTGTVTNENGYYSLKLPEENATIVYSFIGYQMQERSINLKSDKTLNIILEQNEEMLQEISITSQRKFFGNMDYGRDIPTVKSEEIEKLNSTNASDILHARLAGVWATKTSGAPGDQQKIRIRGQASLFSSSEPLYVIDGVPVPIVNLASLGIGDLNMHDIESVTVLKDASSTALYGYQGGNGVVLIDTKQRSEHKLDFSYRTGLQWFKNYYDLMDTKDFLESLQLAKTNIKSNIYKYYPEYSDTLCDHNRQDEIFQMGNLQEYQLSGGGKLNKTTWYLSGNYSDHAGILIGTSQKKYGFSSRVGTNIGRKLALSFSYRWSHQENVNNLSEYMGNNLIFMGLTKAPCLESTPFAKLAKSRGHYYNRMLSDYILLNDTITPVAIRNNNQNSMNYSSNAASLMGRYQINEHLGINLIESFMDRHSNFANKSQIYRSYELSGFLQINDIQYESKENVVLLNHQINLSFSRQFGGHKLGLSAAQRFYIDNLNWQVDTLSARIPDHFYMKNSMAGYGSQGSVIRMLSSYILHATYNYENRYFVSAIGHLGKIKQGFYINNLTLFPSFSMSWDVAKEPFMSSLNWINELNVYTNYGTSGNFPLIGIANDITEHPYYLIWQTSPTNSYIKQLTNHYLKHERNKEFDLGFKSSLFNRRLNLSGAAYSKKIDNQIVLRDIPYYYGGGQYYVNLGDINVNGLEISVEGRLIERKNANWMVRGNFSQNSQHVTKLADGEDLQFLSDDLLFPSFLIKEGQPLGDIYGYEYLGRYTAEDKGAKDIRYVNVGGFKYANSDTTNSKLDENDLKVIGNSIPDFNWNFSSSFQYQNLGLDVVIYSSWGMQKYNATRAATFIAGVNNEVLPFYSDSLSGLMKTQFYASSYFIDDASFIRLKTVALSYKLRKFFRGMECTLSLDFENFITLTRYSGYDPEATIFTDNNFSDNAIDRGAYPNPKSVSVGINIKL